MGKLSIIGGLLILFAVCFLFPVYTELIDKLIEVIEAMLTNPFTPTVRLLFYSVPIVFLVAIFFGFARGIHKRSGGGRE